MERMFQKPIGFAFAFVMCIVISGCSEKDTADVALCRERLSNVIHGFETNCSFDKGELLDALDMVSAVGNKAQRAMLLGEFEDELFKADIAHFNVRDQLLAIDSFVVAADLLRQRLLVVAADDGWHVQVRTVSWVKGQLDRIKKSEPETPESRAGDARLWNEFVSAWNIRSEEVFFLLFMEWMKKHPPIRRGVVKNHRAWEQVANGGKDHILRPLILRCMRDVEDESCPSELRQKRLKELESVVGVSMRDETSWNEHFKFKGKGVGGDDITVDVDL